MKPVIHPNRIGAVHAGSGKPRPVRQHGYTLLEMIVVLVIVSLLSGLLVSGLSHVLILSHGFANQSVKMKRQQLQESWVRSLLAGIASTRGGSPDKFSGDSKRLSGISFSPMDATPGAPGAFRLRFRSENDRTYLEYTGQTPETWLLGHWPSQNAGFTYRDGKGRWHDQWPPRQGRFEQLPQAIRVQVKEVPEPIYWLVRVAGDRTVRFDIYEQL